MDSVIYYGQLIPALIVNIFMYLTPTPALALPPLPEEDLLHTFATRCLLGYDVKVTGVKPSQNQPAIPITKLTKRPRQKSI